MSERLGSAQADADEALAELVERGAAAKLYAGDGSLWSDDPDEAREIGGWIGWLPVVAEMEAQAGELQAFARDAAGGFERTVLCGMGGSSLAPLVFADAFDASLVVLDTTDPDAVNAVPVDGSLFVVASKSGTTMEPEIMEEHFFAAAGRDGQRFVAITDPGSKLEARAAELGFRRVFSNRPDIGGRYSALSYFGLVPAALAGIDVGAVLASAARMRDACAPSVAGGDNPALRLGAILGGLARNGRDKCTIVASPAIARIGLWLEQLLAESTGKHGQGVVPLADEALGMPDVYRDDRLFVHLRTDATHDAALAQLAAAGQPVVTIDVDGPEGLGGEMLRFELATAYAGALLGINPFDQPNVQAAKDFTVSALKAFAETRKLDEVADGDVAEALGHAEAGRSYVAIQAYVTPSAENEEALQDVRRRIRNALGVATSMGFGPRYLHSTGQLHKGGPPTGVFLQVLADSDSDAEIPGRPYGFRTVIEAQSRGDASALLAAGRPVARTRLSQFAAAVDAALQKG